MVMVLIVGFEWNMGFYQIGGNPASCSIIKGDIGIGISLIEKSLSRTRDNGIQLDYPSLISYPQMEQFDITIYNYSVNAAYCKVSAEFGKMSVNKIYLGKENQMTYYFPEGLSHFVFDSIRLEFYDENAKLVDNIKLYMEYSEEAEHFQVIQAK